MLGFSLLFHHTEQIYDQESEWGKTSTCDFGVYIPICQTCFGIIMTVMFIICGKGGKSEPHAFLPQPWRIVSPALMFFLVMTMLSIADVIIIQSGMNKFCESFAEYFPDVDCDTSMNRYVTVPTETLTFSPGTFHKSLIPSIYIALTCWVASFIVLIVRVIFVIDFQLVRVTVKTIEYEKADENSKFKVVDEKGKDDLATTNC